MPIKLTRPFLPGDTDPGRTYDHMEIVSFRFDLERREISFSFALGTLDDSGHFVPGLQPPVEYRVADRPAREGRHEESLDYSALMAELPAAADEPIAVAVARVVYTHVLTRGLIDGTPVL